MTSEDFNGLQNLFAEGQRNNTLFHIVLCAMKGGLKEDLARETAVRLALQCNPSLSVKEAHVIVDSVLKRIARRERNFSENVREWVMTSNGFFLTSDCYKELQMTSRQDQKNCYLTLMRMCEGENRYWKNTAINGDVSA